MQRSRRNRRIRPADLEAIAAHARSLERHSGSAKASEAHADVCARRQIEIRDQELRSLVVRRSLLQTHCVIAFGILLILLALLGPASIRLDRDVLCAFITLSSFVIAASASSIKMSLSRR